MGIFGALGARPSVHPPLLHGVAGGPDGGLDCGL